MRFCHVLTLRRKSEFWLVNDLLSSGIYQWGLGFGLSEDSILAVHPPEVLMAHISILLNFPYEFYTFGDQSIWLLYDFHIHWAFFFFLKDKAISDVRILAIFGRRFWTGGSPETGRPLPALRAKWPGLLAVWALHDDQLSGTGGAGQGLVNDGIDVPTVGDWFFFFTKTNICWRWNISKSWVMWTIGTFTNPCSWSLEIHGR